MSHFFFFWGVIYHLIKQIFRQIHNLEKNNDKQTISLLDK